MHLSRLLAAKTTHNNFHQAKFEKDIKVYCFVDIFLRGTAGTFFLKVFEASTIRA